MDEEDLGAKHIAEQLGEVICQVFKTLVLKGDRNGYFVCVVPGNAEIDLKKAAHCFQDKKCDLIPLKDLLPLTGYVRGGCSPVGMKKNLPTLIHESSLNYGTIYVSAGVRGLQLKLAPSHLIRACNAIPCDLICDR